MVMFTASCHHLSCHSIFEKYICIFASGSNTITGIAVLMYLFVQGLPASNRSAKFNYLVIVAGESLHYAMVTKQNLCVH